MKKLIVIMLIILLGNNMQAQSIRIDNYSGIQGNTLSVALKMDDFSNLGAITLFIQYDTLVLSFDSYSQVHPLVSDLLVNPMANQSALGIAWSASLNGIYLSDDTLCILHFSYLGGDCPLSFGANSEFADFTGGVMSASYLSGSVSPWFEAQILNVSGDFCVDDAVVTLLGSPQGGYFYIDLIEGTSFSPASAGPGIHEIKYAYTNGYGVSDTATQMVTVHAIPTWTSDYEDISCYGFSDGSITLTMISGTPPFVFSWSNGAVSNSLSALSAGSYSFTVTAANCTASSGFTLSQPSPLELNISMQPASAISQSDGALTTQVSGGQIPYSYLWSNASTLANQSLLTEGYYSLSVSDANQCQVSEEIYLRAMAGQEIPLPAQWSIFSMNVEAMDPEISVVLSELGTNIQLVKDENGAVYWPQFNVNGIGNTEIGEGYMIRLSNPDTLHLTAYYIHPEDYAINLPLNWSIFGYLRTSPQSIISLLSPVVSSLSIVKNSNGAVYWPQFNLDMIGTLNPGEGYQIKMIQPAIYFFPQND